MFLFIDYYSCVNVLAMQVRLKYKNLLLSNGLKRLSSLTPWQPYSVGERTPSPQFSSKKFVHMKNTPRISDLLLAPLKNHDSWNPKDFEPGSISKDFHRANQSFEKCTFLSFQGE